MNKSCVYQVLSLSISFEILGAAGHDNALWARVDSGQSIRRLLFDCGENTASSISFGDLQQTDHLFFSHLHMDHIAGFDAYFRATFNREKPNEIWGPPQTGEILSQRFRGYMWNLHHGIPGAFRVHDIDEREIRSQRWATDEAFATAHDDGSKPREKTVVETPDFTVECLTMNHGTPSLAYVVREKPRRNIDTEKLQRLGLRTGAWLKQLRNPAPGQTAIEIDGVSHPLQPLRDELMVEVPGWSIGYLTDFLLDAPSMERAAEFVRGSKTLVCESQYRHADLELATRNFHMTAKQAGELAARAVVGEMILFHVSERYTPEVWQEMLREAKAVFPRTRFAEHWKI